MTVDFDADTGRLRLDQLDFDCLVDWANGAENPGPELADLREAGVVTDEVPHPSVVPGLQAVSEPVCQMRIAQMDDRGKHRSGDGWLNRDAAALLLDSADGLRELVTVLPTLLPAVVARIVQLGPRPRPGVEPLGIPTAMFDGMLSSDPEERRAASASMAAHAPEPPMPDVVESFVTGPWRCWSVSMAWLTPEGEQASSNMQVVDTLSGLCMLDIEEQNTSLWPTTATEVWRRLSKLLPDDVET
ncbi:MAG: hypothetical protein ACRDXX_11585 [Stackebrandtia sp.]